MSEQSFLGARFTADATKIVFRVAAPAATRLEVWIYDSPVDAPPLLNREMPRGDDGVFGVAIALSELGAAGTRGFVYYGLRAWGPNWTFDATWKPGQIAGFVSDVDAQGNRFNPNKLLLDPYALEITHSPLTPAYPSIAGYQSGPLSRQIDSGPFAPKGIAIGLPTASFGAKPTRAFKDDIIYEVHMRGLTKNDPLVPAALQGTYAGAARRAPYLADMGFTAIEFLPIHETQNGLNDAAEFNPLQNYWGYDSVSFFAPDRRYASDKTPGGPTREWLDMVRAFHAVGLKVYIDVVYNHHNEGAVDTATGSVGAIYSLRGLDNAAYYETLGPGAANQYQNHNGVGPNVNVANPLVRALVLDSLQYWTGVLGVDGFRFDLAAVLGNERQSSGYDYSRDNPDNILNRAVRELPARPPAGGPGVDLTGEPYTADGSPAGQQQGNLPNGWSEWNDRYRDTVRAAQNKLGIVAVTPAQLATRIAGSDDLFRSHGHKPWSSVNYISCHDGFTLRDLYSFNDRHNDLPFPQGPSGGGRSAADELCWDQGGDPVQQRQAVRTGLALLLLSAGTPLVSGGSEFYRTQFGNNNPFNLDTVANWLDWSAAAAQTALTAYTRELIHFRSAHPCLRPADFFTGRAGYATGLKDLAWYRNDGAECDAAYFQDHTRHFLAYRLNDSEFGGPAISIYVAYNGWIDPVSAAIPMALPEKSWYVVADTSAAAESWGNIHPSGQETHLTGGRYSVQGRSVLLLIER